MSVRSFFRFALAAPLALAAGTCARPVSAAEPPAEPPAYVAPAPAAIAPAARRAFTVEAAIQEAWAAMGSWSDGISELESRAHASGLPITTSNNPAYTTSFDAVALAGILPRLFVGLHYDRITGKSEFEVRESLGPGGTGGSTEFPTVAEAASNAWMLAARWMIPGDRRGVRPYLQLGAGAGNARFDFVSSGGVARGKGRGFAGAIEAGLQVGDGPVRARIATGYRLHRVPLAYRSVDASSQPGVSRYFFDFDDELRDFATGRDVDLSGAFGRLGVAIAWTR